VAGEWQSPPTCIHHLLAEECNPLFLVQCKSNDDDTFIFNFSGAQVAQLSSHSCPNLQINVSLAFVSASHHLLLLPVPCMHSCATNNDLQMLIIVVLNIYRAPLSPIFAPSLSSVLEIYMEYMKDSRWPNIKILAETQK